MSSVQTSEILGGNFQGWAGFFKKTKVTPRKGWGGELNMKNTRVQGLQKFEVEHVRVCNYTPSRASDGVQGVCDQRRSNGQ